MSDRLSDEQVARVASMRIGEVWRPSPSDHDVICLAIEVQQRRLAEKTMDVIHAERVDELMQTQAEVRNSRRLLAAIRALPQSTGDGQGGIYSPSYRMGYQEAMRQVKALLDGES